MHHPTEGVLRRLLDEPAAVPEPDRHHTAGCARCSGALATVEEDRDRVAAALDPVDLSLADLDIDEAWRRLSAAAASPGAPSDVVVPLSAGRSRPRWSVGARHQSTGRPRRTARGRLAAGVAATAVLVGASAAAANGWLPIFRTEQVVPVAVSAADLNAVPDLSAFGDYELSGEPDVHDVPDAATAAAETGLEVPEVAVLPRGVEGEPSYQVGDEVSATFTFSADRAAETAADADEPLPPLPPELDGAQVRLVAGPALAAVWDGATGPPALVVGRAVAPTAFSDGVPFETMRDYLLSFPGLSEDLAVQLRAFEADGSTLPLPVPESRIGETSTAEVAGVEATVLATDDGALAAVIWVDDGVLTAVAGSLDRDEVLAVARGLR